MKLHSGLIALVFLFLSTVAHAQEAAEFKNGERPAPRRFSSRDNRADKNFFLGGQILGWGPGSNLQGGFIGGFFLNRDNQILIEATSGSRGWNGLWTEHNIRAQSIGAHLKHFTGNSFYVKGGLDYTEIERKYTDTYSNPDNGYSLKGNKVAASFVIGNQWQWDTFTLGCDWAGLSAPLSHQVTEERTFGNSSYNSSDMASERKEYLEDVTLQLVHFYLGWSF